MLKILNMSRVTGVVISRRRHDLLILISLFSILLSNSTSYAFFGNNDQLLFSIKLNQTEKSLKIIQSEKPKKKSSFKLFSRLSKKKSPLEATDQDGKTPLMLAIEMDQKEIAKALIMRDVDLDHRDKNGDAALMYALKKGDIQLAGEMVDRGADLNFKNKLGLAPLDLLLPQLTVSHPRSTELQTLTAQTLAAKNLVVRNLVVQNLVVKMLKKRSQISSKIGKEWLENFARTGKFPEVVQALKEKGIQYNGSQSVERLTAADKENGGEKNKTNPLKLLTLNLWQFPYGIESKNNNKRAHLLTDKINLKSDQFDVLTFQELWSNKTRKGIYDRIKNKYPFKAEDQSLGAYGVAFHSGLAIYSKFPILRKVQHVFKHYRGHENFAKKGVLGVELDVNGESVYVFTTHLQAGSGGPVFEKYIDRGKPSTTEMSALQLKEAKEVIQKFIRNKDAPVLLAGDFNITAGNEEYDDALKALENARDTFNPSKSKYKATSWNDPCGKNRIDYIMALSEKVKGISEVVDYFGPDVTDHLGAMGSFDISR